MDRRDFLKGAAVLGAIPLFASLGGCGAPDEADVEAYIEEHMIKLDVEAGVPAGSLGDIGRYGVFLAGETHAFLKNYDIKRALIQALQRDAGVNCLLLEVGVGAGMILERFLQTGDEEVLALVMAQMHGTASGCEEEQEFWRWLRDYNEGLEDTARFHVYGLDIDHQTYLALWALKNLVTVQSDFPVTASGYLAALEDELGAHSADEHPKELLDSRSFEELNAFVSDHEEDARDYFGGCFETVKLMVRGHQTVADLYSSEDESVWQTDVRDEYMERAFELIEREDGERVYFGQMGSAHTTLTLAGDYKDLEGYATFAMRLREKADDGRGVCSILYAYRDLKMQADSILSESGWRYFDDTESGDILFDLEAENSPFAKDVDIVDDASGESTTTCFQKLILLSGNEQVTPLF